MHSSTAQEAKPAPYLYLTAFIPRRTGIVTYLFILLYHNSKECKYQNTLEIPQNDGEKRHAAEAGEGSNEKEGRQEKMLWNLGQKLTAEPATACTWEKTGAFVCEGLSLCPCTGIPRHDRASFLLSAFLLSCLLCPFFHIFRRNVSKAAGGNTVEKQGETQSELLFSPRHANMRAKEGEAT